MFGQNRVISSEDIADIEFAMGGDGGMQSHFGVKPKLMLGQVELGFDNNAYIISGEGLGSTQS